MDNPIIDDMDEGEFIVEFYHEIEDDKIVLAFVEELANGTEIVDTIVDPFPAFEPQSLDSFEGHKFRAIVEDTNEVLADFVVSRENRSHFISRPAMADSHDEL